jgi:hypothetical protein
MFRVVGSSPARWPHLALGSVLGLGSVALIAAATWVVEQPSYLCDEGVSPNGWIYAGFILFALGLPAFVIWGVLQLHEDVHRVYVAIAVGEAVVSLALALYLGSKHGHYSCG